jgi:hypothetical protein
LTEAVLLMAMVNRTAERVEVSGVATITAEASTARTEAAALLNPGAVTTIAVASGSLTAFAEARPATRRRSRK